jgi:cytochrome c peroxidase
MRNARSLGPVPGEICNLNITRGVMVRDRRPRSPVQTGSKRRWLSVILVVFSSTEVLAQTDNAALIERGRQLFFNETFEGNGRTCGTCHPATNNFTIDPAFVRRLPQSDPLFVVKSTKELRDLEIKQFLRQGTILENLDGFINPGVMRGVPHTLALGPSTRNGATGWSGDGSPGDLRDFAIGAVTQHFPKTLARRPCTLENFDPNLCDFRLPTSEELDAMLAFQLSLGRQADIDLAALPAFNDATVELGRELFDDNVAPARGGGTRRCSGCHENAGTNDEPRDTGVAKLPTAPACQFGFKVPGDGGLGRAAAPATITTKELCGKGPNKVVTFLGDGTFNVPPAIEAADTPPFFHNNAVATLEGAVAFYTSDTFNESPAGDGRAFVLDQTEINAIAAFLRALNAMENVRSSNAFLQRALEPAELAPASELIEWANAETTDAIEVLTEGPIKLWPDAVALLKEAQVLERQAMAQDPPNADLLEDAIAYKEAAHDQMLAP